jgi:hypothetical protein
MATAMPYILPLQTIIETPAYLSDVKALGLTDVERTTIVDYIAQHPSAGEVMPSALPQENLCNETSHGMLGL